MTHSDEEILRTFMAEQRLGVQPKVSFTKKVISALPPRRRLGGYQQLLSGIAAVAVLPFLVWINLPDLLSMLYAFVARAPLTFPQIQTLFVVLIVGSIPLVAFAQIVKEEA